MFNSATQSEFASALKKAYTWYTGGFATFVIILAIA